MRKLVPSLLVGLLVSALSTGCFTRTAVEVPETKVTVVDAESGKPIEDATVLLEYAEVHPHYRSIRNFSQTTDADGITRYRQRNTKVFESYCVMHGVGFYGYCICVVHEGYQTQHFGGGIMESELPASDEWDVAVQMTPGESTKCEEARWYCFQR